MSKDDFGRPDKWTKSLEFQSKEVDMLALVAEDSNGKVTQITLPDTSTLDNVTREGFTTNSVFKKLQNYAPRRLENSVCSNGDGVAMKADFFNDVEYTLG